MFTSTPFSFTYQGAPAQMVVCRNDGYCWGQFTVGGKKFDVVSADDAYAWTDSDAAAAFILAAQDVRNVSQALR